jgi:DNA-binding NarL/FixJ family response regulator
MKKILIVEDHTIVRQGMIRLLQDLLEEQFGFDEASDGHQAVKMSGSCRYDLILLDISLPDKNGLDVLKLILQHDPRVPVIIVSTHPEEHYAVRSLRSGAAGYVNKGSAPAVLKSAIEKVLSGRRYVSPSQAELLAEAICDTGENAVLHNTLSDREYQLACLMTVGKTLTEIARDLSLSVKTVSTYRARILEKLQLKTTADIINYCLRHGLTP